MKRRVFAVALLGVLCAAALGIFADFGSAAAFSDGRLVFDLTYGAKVFRYIDHPTPSSNHIMQLEFEKRKINGSAEEKIRLLALRRAEGFSSSECLFYVFPKMKHTIEQAAAAVNVAYRDSKIKFSPNSVPMFSISREKDGLEIDYDRLVNNIVAALIANKRSVGIPTSVTKPLVTYAQNEKCTRLRSMFSTDFSSSIENRKHNIKLTLKKINGAVIEPDGVFSFNKRVGERSVANGYKEAKIILNGQFTEGVGGGVCQVSTTLYNAAIRADLAVVSVRPHSLPVSYVPPSFDAMVNSGSSDLRLENLTGAPIFIRAYSVSDSAVIEFYGLSMPYMVIPESQVLSLLPPSEKDDEIVDKTGKYFKADDDSPIGAKKRISEPKGGLISRGYLNFVDFNNNLIARRQIRQDKYKPQNGLVAIKS